MNQGKETLMKTKTQLSLNLKKTGAKVILQQDLPSYDPAGTTSDFKSINEGGKKKKTSVHY